MVVADLNARWPFGDGEVGVFRARDALDRTDAVLAVADDTLVKAEVAIVQGRRIAPVLVVVVGLVVVGVAALVIMKRRRREPDYDI
jgi:hypothetical protein